VIFRRKGKNDDTEAAPSSGGDDATGTTAEAGESDAPAVENADGPYDVADVEPADLETENRINLGAVVITGQPGMELRLQVDEQTGDVQAVLLVLADSALELRAFAAPKTAGIWTDVRREIAAEATRMGGTASEAEGPFGTELVLVVPVEDPDSGQIFSQTSRVIGVDGPRWLLRGTILGRAAVEPEAAAPMEDSFRSVVVVRGAEPMAPREALPLRLPEGAQPAPDAEV
jgi:hypothetical protein